MSDPGIPSDNENGGASGDSVPSSPRRLIDGPVGEGNGDVARYSSAPGPFLSGAPAPRRATAGGAISKALTAHPHCAPRKQAGPIGTALVKRGRSGGSWHPFPSTREALPDSENLILYDEQEAGVTPQRVAPGSSQPEPVPPSPGTAPTRHFEEDGLTVQPDAVIASNHARPRPLASAAVRAPDTGPQDGPWTRSAATLQRAAELGPGSIPQAEPRSPDGRDARVNCDAPPIAGQGEADRSDDVVPVFVRRGVSFSRETPTAQYTETSHAISGNVGAGRKTRGAASPPHSMQEVDAGAHRSIASDRVRPAEAAPLEKTAPSDMGMMSSTTEGLALRSVQRENTAISIALDEDMLRQIVSETVRAHLQGTVGVRVSSNLRKIVRREVRLFLGVEEQD